MKAVGSGGERLALDGDIVGEGDSGVLVGTGTPGLAVGNNFAEDFAAADQRRVVGDGDVGETDTLRYAAVLADAGQN